MRHLFFIHSQITFVVSVMVIKYLKLNFQDCTFLIHRGTSSDYKSLGIKMVDFPFNPHSINSFPMYNRFWKSWARVKELDNFIDEAVLDNEFLFYTPQTYQNYLALIISNKKCKGFSIIEEGGGSYLDEENIEEYYPSKKHNTLYKEILWKLNFFNRIKINRSFIEDGYIHAYGLSPYSFKKLDRRIILGLPTLSDYCFDVETKDGEERYRNILVFDALVEANIIDSGTLIMSTLVLLNNLIKDGCSSLHVKYHPDQLKANGTIRLIRELFKQIGKIDIKEIPLTVSLEEVALKQDATFYVFSSSVGLYASFYGRKVYSLCHIVEGFLPSFSKRIENMPSVFKEKVKFI